MSEGQVWFKILEDIQVLKFIGQPCLSDIVILAYLGKYHRMTSSGLQFSCVMAVYM